MRLVARMQPRGATNAMLVDAHEPSAHRRTAIGKGGDRQPRNRDVDGLPQQNTLDTCPPTIIQAGSVMPRSAVCLMNCFTCP